MAELTDETLMAFADGQLDAAERKRVTRLLEGNPELMAKVRRFEETGAPLRSLYDPVIEAPVPASLVDFVRGLPVAGQSAVTDIAAARRAREEASRKPAERSRGSRGDRVAWLPMALAASVCLAIGSGAGWLAHSKVSGADPKPGTLLQVALENVPGGSEAMLPTANSSLVSIRPVVTFVDKDQRFCRRYVVSGSALSTSEGIACRGSDGRWQVKLEVAKAASEGKGLGTAMGDKPVGVGAMVEQMSQGEELTVAEQHRLIARKWQPLP